MTHWHIGNWGCKTCELASLLTVKTEGGLKKGWTACGMRIEMQFFGLFRPQLLNYKWINQIILLTPIMPTSNSRVNSY